MQEDYDVGGLCAGGNSETIVPKKPRNLFMMVDFQRGFGVKAAEDEYNFQVAYRYAVGCHGWYTLLIFDCVAMYRTNCSL